MTEEASISCLLIVSRLLEAYRHWHANMTSGFPCPRAGMLQGTMMGVTAYTFCLQWTQTDKNDLFFFFFKLIELRMFPRRHRLRVKGFNIAVMISKSYIHRDAIRTHAKATGFPSCRAQAFPKPPAWAFFIGPTHSCIYSPSTPPST